MALLFAKRLTWLPILAVLPLFAATALAAPPPSDAKPLSEIVRLLEERGDVAYIREIDWDDDGYWEIEFVRTDGGRMELEIDPVSGQPRR